MWELAIRGWEVEVRSWEVGGGRWKVVIDSLMKIGNGNLEMIWLIGKREMRLIDASQRLYQGEQAAIQPF